jgi:flagellar hook-basal body complex protein FliE
VTLPIPPIAPPAQAATASVTGASASKASAGFGESLRALVGSVESSSAAANEAVEHMLNGTGDVHEAMIALQRAELTLQLTVQVRNKLVQAYQDIMRMPI